MKETEDVSDSNRPPKPPPDDFTKTTPNIDIPEKKASEFGDYRYPAQPPADDWGNTVANVRPLENDDEDEFGAFDRGANSPQVPDWGITRADINVNEDDFGGPAKGEQNQEFGVTTPYFRLPEAERAKYQAIPPTPTQAAEQKAKEEKEKGGIPTWVWISGTLFTMFFFLVIILLGGYFFFFNKTGFEIIVKNVPRGSSVRIGDAFWGESTPDGSIRLPVLSAGQKTLEIIHPNYKCAPISVVGEDGDIKTVDAKPVCQQVAAISEECFKIKAGDYEKSRQCAYTELGKLSDPPDLDALLRAMNLYINHFDSGKHDIRPEDAKFLQTAAGYMKKIPPETVIEVGGHTDSDGNDTDNQALSERRAEAVKAELINAGIKESMLRTKGYGEANPKADNKTADGKFQNRRIEYSVAK